MVDAVDDTYEGSYIILVRMSLGECVVLVLGAQLLEEDALQLLYIGSGELLKVCIFRSVSLLLFSAK